MTDLELSSEHTFKENAKYIKITDQQKEWNQMQEILIHNLEVESQKLRTVNKLFFLFFKEKLIIHFIK